MIAQIDDELLANSLLVNELTQRIGRSKKVFQNMQGREKLARRE